jgi:type II secretory pathway pseudopilin PulG
LIEIMVVVAIMGIVLAAGVPSLYRFYQKEGFRKTVSEITDVCSATRAQAILSGRTAELIFFPGEGRCAGGGRAASFGDNVTIEMLDVNLWEYREADSARVRFFPDGTSDEMTLILSTDRGEFRRIQLEITTGLASVEGDVSKWK